MFFDSRPLVVHAVISVRLQTRDNRAIYIYVSIDMIRMIISNHSVSYDVVNMWKLAPASALKLKLLCLV